MLKSVLKLMLVMYCTMKSSSSPSVRYPLPALINKITNANATCNSGTFNITIHMKQPFKGVLFAKDFSHECRIMGGLSHSLTINLPSSGCGVRLSSDGEDMFYAVTLIIQQDPHLRQFTDQEYIIKCQLQDNALTVKSEPMVEALRSDLSDMSSATSFRKGRMKNEAWLKNHGKDNKSDYDASLTETLAAARAWMEIVPEQGTGNSGTLKVGESSLLVIKSTLPVGIGWKVVGCMAHDGLGDSSQKLLDDQGCPIDELLMPSPLVGIPRPIALMRYQDAVSKFAAFKFPDRNRLHLSCGLELCRGMCAKVNCIQSNDTDLEENKLTRIIPKGESGEILDRFEVYNSVEVIAPEIELEDLRSIERENNNDGLTLPYGSFSGDKTVCVSPDKMAITFAILGIIFLCAVLVSAGALMKARRSGHGLPHYSRSIFSSSSGGSGYGGSKLLLHDNPCVHHQSASAIPYGRVF